MSVPPPIAIGTESSVNGNDPGFLTLVHGLKVTLDCRPRQSAVESQFHETCLSIVLTLDGLPCSNPSESQDQQAESLSPEMLTTVLSPHLALVTGATGGIGKATCIGLAALGCSIAVHYNSAADDAGELVKQLEAEGVRAKAFQADLGKYDDVSCTVHVDNAEIV